MSEVNNQENKKVNLVYLIGTVGFVLCLVASSLMLFAFPSDEASVKSENRNVTAMPGFTLSNITKGVFTSEFEAYLNDHVAYRGDLKEVSNTLENNTGFDIKSGEFLRYQKDIGTATKDDTLLLYHDYSLREIYYEDEAGTEEYIKSLGNIAKAAKGLDCYSMIIPTALEFDDEYYSSVESSQKNAIDKIYDGVGADFVCVDAYSNLQKHKSDYIYFRTDHHWTQLGAYYAYEAYCKSAGLTPVELSDYKLKTFSTALTKHIQLYGSLYNYTKYPALKSHPDKLNWYDVDPNGLINIVCKGRDGEKLATYDGTMFDKGINEPGYNFYLSGDHAYIKLRNDNAETDKTLLIIRDSYANAFIPWLIQNYQTIIVYDPRSQLDEFCDLLALNKPDDILVMNYMFSTGFVDYCETLNVTATMLGRALVKNVISDDDTIVTHDTVIEEAFHDIKEYRDGYNKGAIQISNSLDKSIKKYFMIIPTRAVVDNVVVGTNVADQHNVMEEEYDLMDGKYECIDAFDTLVANKDKYLFFRTDHHWTELGAYYAYREFCKSVSVEPVDLKDYKKNVQDGFLGSLYKQKPTNEAKGNPDSIEWYDIDPDGKITFDPVDVVDGKRITYKMALYDLGQPELKYSFFLGGDHKFVKITNPDVKNDKTLLIAHDSYGNAMIPWLVNNYSTIISYDPLAQLPILSELLNGEKIDDFLLINYIPSLTSDRYPIVLAEMADQLKNIKK